jgi:ferric-dicitrate binding protein FerR (iron transport regulator)
LEAVRAALRSAVGAGPNPFAMRRLRREVLERAAGRAATPPLGRARGAAFARALVALTTFALVGLGLSSLWQRGLAPSGVRVAISPTSRFSEEEARDRRIVRIVEGTFDFDVRPSADGRRLLVIVPDGEIEDIGTKFRVVVEAGRTVEVSVSEGEVEVRRERRAPERLVAGMTFRPRPEPSSAVSPSVPASTPPSSSSSASSSVPSSPWASEIMLVSPPNVRPSPRSAPPPARVPDA